MRCLLWRCLYIDMSIMEVSVSRSSLFYGDNRIMHMSVVGQER